MSRYTIHRKDANEKEIVQGLIDIGASVDYWGDNGSPDLVVGFRGVNYLMEIKVPGKKLRPNQETWHSEWKGDVHTVESLNHALWILGLIDWTEE